MNSSNSTSESPVDTAVRRRSRLTLIGIFAAFAVPLLLAMIWLRVVQSGGGGELGDTSRGELVQPVVPVVSIALTDTDGQPLDADTLRGIWTMAYVPVGECGEVCRRNLYHMRQIRLALNNRMKRVQRMVLPDPSAPLDEELLAEHVGLVVVGEAARDAYVAAIDSTEEALAPVDDAIYLIDPLGNLMMRFSPDLPPESILKDVKHLLKVSKIG